MSFTDTVLASDRPSVARRRIDRNWESSSHVRTPARDVWSQAGGPPRRAARSSWLRPSVTTWRRRGIASTSPNRCRRRLRSRVLQIQQTTARIAAFRVRGGALNS